MDRYRYNLITQGSISFISDNGEEEIKVGERIIFAQNEDYRVGGYKLVFVNPNIASITYKDVKYKSSNGTIEIPFDFSDVGPSLIISFVNDLADDCVVPVKIEKADIKKFDEKLEEQREENLVRTAYLDVTTGPSLINVYFKKLDESIDRIVLTINYHSSNGQDYLVTCQEVEGECFALEGLASGVYEVTIEEYNGDDLVVSSSKEVTLRQ